MAIWTPTLKTKAKKLREEGLRQVYQVEVPAGKLQEALHNVFVRLQLTARVPGFRQGKAPLDVIKKQYASAARNEAVDQLIQQVVPEVLKDLDVRPVAIPAVGSVSALEDGTVSFELHVEVAPKIEPKGYKGIDVSRKEYSVEETEVESRLRQLQEGNARLEKAEAEAVGKDHYVVMDYELLQDGKPVEGGSGRQELVDMSSDQTLDGLAAGLAGAKRQETREIEVKLDGRPAVCKATVQEIKVKILPKLDDEFAKDIGVESLEKLREELRKLIARENEERSDREMALQLEEALLKANKFEAPPTLVEHQLEHMARRVTARLVGPDRELPQEQAGKLREELKPQAAKQVRLQLLLSEIARKEGVEATDADFDEELRRTMEAQDDEKRRQQTREFFTNNKEDILAAIRERKTIRMIREAAKVKTEKA